MFITQIWTPDFLCCLYLKTQFIYCWTNHLLVIMTHVYYTEKKWIKLIFYVLCIEFTIVSSGLFIICKLAVQLHEGIRTLRGSQDIIGSRSQETGFLQFIFDKFPLIFLFSSFKWDRPLELSVNLILIKDKVEKIERKIFIKNERIQVLEVNWTIFVAQNIARLVLLPRPHVNCFNLYFDFSEFFLFISIYYCKNLILKNILFI